LGAEGPGAHVPWDWGAEGVKGLRAKGFRGWGLSLQPPVAPLRVKRIAIPAFMAEDVSQGAEGGDQGVEGSGTEAGAKRGNPAPKPLTLKVEA